MVLSEKAKELGREITKTPEFQELQRAEQVMREDSAAQQLVKEFQEAQQKMAFMQKTGTEPTPEQVEGYNGLQEKIKTSVTVKGLLKAQDGFNTLIKTVNESISQGISEGTVEQ